MSISPGEADLEERRVLSQLQAHVLSFPQGAFEPPRKSDYSAVCISKKLGSTGCEAEMLVFGVKYAPRAKLSPGLADLVTHKGVRTPHARVFRFFVGLFGQPRESDRSAVGIYVRLGSTGYEAAMLVFGCKCAP